MYLSTLRFEGVVYELFPWIEQYADAFSERINKLVALI